MWGMPKVTLDINAFKALASDTRLDILRSLDGKRLNLKDISGATNLHQVTVHEHLTKLIEVDLVKKIEREGHKWVYYKLSWKGASLMHPENTRITILFSIAFISLFIGIAGLIDLLRKTAVTTTENGTFGPGSETIPLFQTLSLYITVSCFILFTILIILSLIRLKKNIKPKL